MFFINHLLTARTCIVIKETITMKVGWKKKILFLSRVVDEQGGLVNSVCDEYAPDV